MMEGIKTNSLQAWWLASRPKTLTGAVAPVLVGGAMAFSMVATRTFGANYFSTAEEAFFSWLPEMLAPFALCLLFAMLMQIDANFINDYFDFKKGSDRADRLGPERACAQGWITLKAMKIGIIVTTVLSCLVGLAIMLWHMQFELLIVGVLCVLFCFLYTTKLSYQGWGDVLVLVFFGLVPVVFTYYVMTGGEWSLPAALAGLAIGIATDSLLMVNNYRDRHQDRISGKRTIVVRIIEKKIKDLGETDGQKKGEQICLDLYLWLGIISTLLAFLTLFLYPHSSIRIPLMFIYAVQHFKAFQQLHSLDGKELNQVLGATALNIFFFGLLLAISIFF